MKTGKRYISDAIKVEEYAGWLNGKKILLNAPTGTGKTTFILDKFLPYCSLMRKKVLILCNRRLLKEQYSFDLADRYIRYAQMHESVEVWTYQMLAEKSKNVGNVRNMFSDFDVLVCDEIHFFYSDSDFNAYGTYVLFQILVMAGFYKTMVMITATAEEVLPLIDKTFRKCEEKLLQLGDGTHIADFEHYCFHRDGIYDFGYWADFDRFECIYVPDIETLCNEIATSDMKSLIFIDDKAQAEELRIKLTETGRIDASDVFLLNSQKLEEKQGDCVIQSLAIAHKIVPKVLITTSVLDNGVSIHDENVGNVVIATESKVSFLQMLGRVRSESVEKCRLFVFPRTPEYYQKRIRQYGEKVQRYENLMAMDLNHRAFDVMSELWYGPLEYSEFLRNAIVLTKEDREFYGEKIMPVALRRGEITLAVNAFAMEKAGNMLITEQNLYARALEDPFYAAAYQCAWLGKSEDELKVMNASYKEERRNQLADDLLNIKDMTKDELKIFKSYISKEYRKDILKDVISRDGAFSKDKLETICKMMGMELISREDDNRKMRYTVTPKREEGEHKIDLTQPNNEEPVMGGEEQ